MVEYSSLSLDSSLYALSDPTRRKMLVRIAERSFTVSELAEPFDMSLAAVSKHLQVLERAKLIKKEKVGRTITCKANLAPLGEIMNLLERLGIYWNSQLDSLETFLQKEGNNDGQKNSYANSRSSARGKSKKR